MPATLVRQLRQRLTNARTNAETTMGDPHLGTVELTIDELSQMLDMHDLHDAEKIAHEYTTGLQAAAIRKRNTQLDEINLATLSHHCGDGSRCTLADKIAEILRPHK